MKGLGRWLLTGFVVMAFYGAFRPLLITGTNSTDVLITAAMPVAIGVACLIGIIMIIMAFGNKLKR